MVGVIARFCYRAAMETELARWRCVTEDETHVVVVELQHFPAQRAGAPVRNYPGARRFALTTGETVRYIDSDTFALSETGELLRRIA